MPLAIEIEGADVADFLGRLRIDLEKARPVIERSAVNTVRDHFIDLGATRQNRLGAPSTGYWKSGAESVSGSRSGDDIDISTQQVGVRHHYEGGTIEPKKAEFLTIPAIALAHGKRAREFNNLTFMWNRAKKGARLVDTGQDRVVFWLVDSVTKQPDPDVLPSDDTIHDNLEGDLRVFFGAN